MKRVIWLCLFLGIFAGLVIGCGGKETPKEKPAEPKQSRVPPPK